MSELKQGYVLANTRRSPNIRIMLDQLRRRWAKILSILDERLVFAGIDVLLLFDLNHQVALM